MKSPVNTRLALARHFFHSISTAMEIEKAVFQDIERRAFDARMTVAELCAKAGVSPQAWSRAKSRKRVSVVTIRRMEAALDA